MKYGILAVILLSVSISYAADFTGTYQCKGHDPYLDINYTGTVHIVPQNTVYSLQMEYSTGEKFVGTGGLYDDKTISVVFQDPNDLKQVGLERYSYSQDQKKIQGYWVYLGKDKLGSEVCEKQQNKA
jgi:hypothetical protein